MLVSIVLVIFCGTTIQASSSRSGFGKEYLNTNYTPLIAETVPMLSQQVLSKQGCLTACLNENDCSLAVFNKIDEQCALYNLFPSPEGELLADDSTVVFTFELTFQLSPLVSNTDWLLSRLNSTSLIKTIPIPYVRSLAMDVFGYLLSLESSSGNIYVNRYDRTSFTLVKRSPLPIPYTTLAILTYYNNMKFISGPNDTVYIFDQVNLTLLGNITCGTNLNQPRSLTFMESQNLMIIASFSNNKLVYFRINSPTSYTCLNSTFLNGGPQGLLRINDTFYYATMYTAIVIYSFRFDGQRWVQSLFANVSEDIGLSTVKLASLHVDTLQRRWVMVPSFGLAVYDQWGNYLGKWKTGSKPFDVVIFNDYRLIIGESGNANLSLYDPQVRYDL